MTWKNKLDPCFRKLTLCRCKNKIPEELNICLKESEECLFVIAMDWIVSSTNLYVEAQTPGLLEGN